MRVSLIGLVVLGCLGAAGCNCRPNVTAVTASIQVSPSSVDFVQVKTTATAQRTLTINALTRVPLEISDVRLSGEDAAAFTLGVKPTQIDALGSAPLVITFAPTELRAYAASLSISSNDPDHPTVRVPLVGEGSRPIITVRTDCQVANGCTGTATQSPPALDFGTEPKDRLVELPVTRLPNVIITNDGPVALTVSKFAIEGPDAAAFVLAGNTMFPAAGMVLESMSGFNAPIRFKPTSEARTAYTAQLVVESDDPQRPRLTVALSGALRPNLPPVVCANLVRVVPPPSGDTPRDYSSSAQWAPLKTPPAAGYDFTRSRDVRPGELAIFSALSDAADQQACSFDPEDGRTSVTYSWRLVSAPAGARTLPIAGATTPQAQLRPVVTGEYVLELTVKDVQLHATSVLMTFAVSIKQDLVAQLQWTGFSDVDFDVHLVRPTAPSADPFAGVFTFFTEGTANKTSSDINGYAVSTQRSMPGAGFDFDWGQAGSSDDPTLNVDDIGNGPLLENVSLNFPENDARCENTSCTYKVLVHYFKDGRVSSPLGCVVDGGAGCLDGQQCTCAASTRCVADGAPIGDAGLGSGKCFVAPQPVVRLFFKGSPTPAAVIPLDTLVPPDELVVGAPCQMLYVADVQWPAKSAIGSLADGGTPPPVVVVKGADGSGRITAPLVARYGWRQTGGSLQCSPDLSVGGTQWYGREP